MPRNLLFDLTSPTFQMASQSPSFEPTRGISFVVDYVIGARIALRHHYQRLKARYDPGIFPVYLTPSSPPAHVPRRYMLDLPALINIKSEATIALGGTRPISHVT